MEKIIFGIIGAVIGVVGAFLVQNFLIKKRKEQIIRDAEKEGENLKQNKILQAKEKFLTLKEEHEKNIKDRERKLQSSEDRIKSKESGLSKKIEDLSRKEKQVEKTQSILDSKVEALEVKHVELDKIQRKHTAELSKISGMSVEEAKAGLVEALKDEARTAAMTHINEITEEAKLNANREAKKIVIQTIQRVATEQAVENSVSVFNIESDEVKGRIIGREGRNIRALEAATGVEIIVDDTPEAIILSCFDPVRREIARLALHQLVSDGRIHPARIEEIVAKTRKQLEEEIAETGRRTCIDLGIHGLKPELTRMVGRMKYRSSYGQNLLQHSREVANLCAIMAAELGLNVKLAKRAGLLHDIGKVPDEQPELPHAILGMQMAEKYGEKPEICNAIGAHHDEIEMTTLISPIVQVCDAISGARPGARREIVESYIKRIKELEGLALAYDGVSSAYAIQAGRELRVLVESDKVTDAQADELSFTISQRIQTEMTYPGQVKVTLIREKRAVNYAKQMGIKRAIEQLKEKHVLVTGGAGFIGSNLVHFLLENGIRVSVLDNLSTGKRSNLNDFIENPNFNLIEGDITDFNTCFRALSGIDVVSHQAALGSVPRSIEFPHNTHSVNATGFLNMLHASKEKGVKRFVYASSSSVYGNSRRSPKRIGEEGDLLSPYAVTKQLNEEYAKVYARLHEVETIGLRYFNVFGPKQDPNGVYAAAIPKFIDKMIKGEQLTINGDGEQTRDFTYVQNAVNANVLALGATDERAFGKAFNVACGHFLSLNNVISAIKENLQTIGKYNENTSIVHGPDRPGDVRDSLADITDTIDILKYEDAILFAEGMKELCGWIK